MKERRHLPIEERVGPAVLEQLELSANGERLSWSLVQIGGAMEHPTPATAPAGAQSGSQFNFSFGSALALPASALPDVSATSEQQPAAFSFPPAAPDFSFATADAAPAVTGTADSAAAASSFTADTSASAFNFTFDSASTSATTASYSFPTASADLTADDTQASLKRANASAVAVATEFELRFGNDKGKVSADGRWIVLHGAEPIYYRFYSHADLSHIRSELVSSAAAPAPPSSEVFF